MARKFSDGTGSREAYWRRQVGAWERSGESVRGYCRSRGLSEAGFHFWKRELKRRDAGAASKADGAAKATPPSLSPAQPAKA